MVYVSHPASDTVTPIFRLLDTNGDGSGTDDASVNGSITAQVFKINPPTTGVIIVNHVIVSVRNTTGFTTDNFGGITALTTGVQFGRINGADSITEDYLDGVPIKDNADWSIHTANVELKTWGGTPADDILEAEFDFRLAGCAIALLPGDDALGFKINDDLSTIAQIHFRAEGYSAATT